MILVHFEVYYDGEFWCARGTEAAIFTQGRTLDELLGELREAAELHFEDEIERGERVRLTTTTTLDLPADARAASC